jgi:hypothetical protein
MLSIARAQASIANLFEQAPIDAQQVGHHATGGGHYAGQGKGRRQGERVDVAFVSIDVDRRIVAPVSRLIVEAIQDRGHGKRAEAAADVEPPALA